MASPHEDCQQLCCKLVDAVASGREWKLDVGACGTAAREENRNSYKLNHHFRDNGGAKLSSIVWKALRKQFNNGKAIVRKMPDEDRCRFLELPIELRIMIYSYVFTLESPSTKVRPAIKFLTEDKPIRIHYNKAFADQYLPNVWFLGQLHGGLALLRTCHQIYDESLEVWRDMRNCDRRTQIYPLLRPLKMTRCNACPSRVPWNGGIRCEKCNDIWKDSLCKKHFQPVEIFFALAYCPECQWNALTKKRKLPWYVRCDRAEELYIFKASNPKDLASLLKRSQSYGKTLTSKQLVRVEVKYKYNLSDKELYARYYHLFITWRSELIRSMRASRGSTPL